MNATMATADLIEQYRPGSFDPPWTWVRFRGERGRWPNTVDARRLAATITRHAAG